MSLRIGAVIACAACLIAAEPVRAQKQESGLTERMNARPNMEQVNPMQNKGYAANTFGTKTYASNEFAGIKAALTKSYETRSFFGIKNPWFGRKVFATGADRLAERTARESKEAFRTQTYATREFGSGREASEATTPVATAAQPRPYLVQGKTQSGLDRFTENLQKDLTIDEVRDLLNKGKSD